MLEYLASAFFEIFKATSGHYLNVRLGRSDEENLTADMLETIAGDTPGDVNSH